MAHVASEFFSAPVSSDLRGLDFGLRACVGSSTVCITEEFLCRGVGLLVSGVGPAMPDDCFGD